MQELNAWLSGVRDFETGANLYHRYGDNSFFKSLLKAGPTPYNVKKLGEELQALAPEPPAVPEIPIIPEKPVHQIPEIPKPETVKALFKPEEHAVYLQLHEDIKTLYRQLERNMAMLDFSNDQAQLYSIAKHIVSLRKKITNTWAYINYYDEHGCFKSNPKPKEFNNKEKIQHLRVSNSKAKARLKKKNCLDRERTEQLIIENNKKIIALGGKVK